MSHGSKIDLSENKLGSVFSRKVSKDYPVYKMDYLDYNKGKENHYNTVHIDVKCEHITL